MRNTQRRSPSRRNRIRALHTEPLEPRRVLSTGPLITEFMASNNSTLADGDGNYADWIEIYNPTDQTLDLTGWHLTDDASEPAKWTFPSPATAAQEVLELTPGEFLVVFASGQAAADYVDAGGNLHTTFQLSSSGEYLAIVQPDGLTVEHEYAPEFPSQTSNISYGLAFDVSDSILIDEGANARYVIPTGPIADWNSTAFDDSEWQLGPTGIGYETSPADFDDFIESAIDPGPAGSRPTSVYVRQTFDAANPNAIDTLTLQLRYDDGFVAYLNGIQVEQANEPVSLQWNSEATTTHADDDAVLFQSFNISDYRSHLQTTGNVLAIQLLNIDPNSSDLLLEPLLSTGLASIVLEETGFMDSPTPGEANRETFLGFVEDTQFSIDRGFYDTAIDVAITTATTGAVIVYTTDSTTPEVDDMLNVTNGQAYSNPIHIDSTTTLRAAAFQLGYRPANTDTHTYLYLDDILLQSPNGEAPSGFPSSSVNGQRFDYGMDPNIVNDPEWANQLNDALTQVPTISLVTDGDNLFDPASGIYVNAGGHGRAWERPASVELIQPDSTEGFQIDAGLRIRGGFSRGDFNPKHSFRLFFRGEYGDAKLNYPLFGDEGVDQFDSIDLRTAQNYAWSNNTFNDQLQNTFLRDIYSRDLQRELGHAYTRGRFYQLYINGQYWGLYQTEERPEASYASSYFGANKEDWDAVKASGGQIEATDGDLAAWATLSSLGNAGFATDEAYYFIQGRNPDGTPNAAYEQHLDMDNLIDFMTNVFFTGNQDMPTSLGNAGPNNFWAIRPRDGSHGWRWIAHDNEHNLGTSRDGDPKQDNIYYDETVPTSAGGSVSSLNPKFLHQRLMEHPEYRSRFADRVHRAFFNDGPLTTNNAQTLLDSRSVQIDQAIIAESARWGDQHNEPPLSRDTWATEVAWLRDFFLGQRHEIVLDQLRSRGLYPTTELDAPRFNQFGGAVPQGFPLEIANQESAGTVYYTLNGADPRNPGGSVAGNAIAYSQAVNLTQSLTVNARLHRNGEWSALLKADFLVGTLADATNLRITELSYNPYPALTQFGEQDVDNDRFEFIELINIHPTETIDLSGAHFSAGVDFTFRQGTVLTPGERMLVVRDLAAFDSRHGSRRNIAGVFQNDTGLSNSSETIKLDDATGTTIVEFTYQDGWSKRSDGQGSSLVVIDLEGNYDVGSNWRASSAFGGTPDAESIETIDVLVNEVLTHSDPPQVDAIELYNASEATVDLANWWLSDSSNDFFKYQFSPGTMLDRHAYLVLNETHFNPGGGGVLPDFALNASGDDVWLLDVDHQGKPTRFADVVAFDATLNAVTLGRIPDGSHPQKLFPLANPSLGFQNGAHEVGPIVISEFHYHPSAPPPGSSITEQQLEFVELYNRSNSPVVLNGVSINDDDIGAWRLRGGVDFDFSTLPMGTSLAAGDVLTLVSFDPDNQSLATQFRSIHGIDTTVPLAGPLNGQLDNGGETIRLLAPTEPPVGDVDPVYYLVDRVTYDDLAPWPTESDGSGPGLARLSTGAFGDAASSWLALPPTPGSVAFTITSPGDFDSDGDVDHNDLNLWENGFGTITGANLSDGDSDEDGDVDGSDFLNWQRNFDSNSSTIVIANPVASSQTTAARRVFDSHTTVKDQYHGDSLAKWITLPQFQSHEPRFPMRSLPRESAVDSVMSRFEQRSARISSRRLREAVADRAFASAVETMPDPGMPAEQSVDRLNQDSQPRLVGPFFA